MDLRLPPLPDLLPPNLNANVLSGVSVARADSTTHAQRCAPQEFLPPYLEKLLQLQKLQDQAFGSFHATSEHLPPAVSSSNSLSDISGTDLAPIQGSRSSLDQHPTGAFASSASSSFVEVDEQ